jgi:hypothetical protein
MNALIKLTNLIVEAIGASILRELSGAEVRQVGPACALQSFGLITQETAYPEFRKEPNYFTRLNNYN